MLYVKNLVFLDGAIARLAPDLDLFAEIAHIATYFATAHGARITADVGVDPRTQVLDLSGVKASFGVDTSTETLTYRDLQERRAIIRDRLEVAGHLGDLALAQPVEGAVHRVGQGGDAGPRGGS